MWHLILHPAQSNRLWKVLKAWHAVSELWRLSTYCAGGLSIEKTGDADTGWADALAWWRQLWGLGLGGDGAVVLSIGAIRSRQTSEEHPNDITSFFLCFPGDTGFLNSFFPDWYSWPAEQRLPFRYNALRTMYWWLDRKVWKLIRYLIYVWIRRIWSNSVSNPFPPAAVANQSLACALNNIFISDNIIDSWISKNNADDWEKKTFHAIHPNKHCSFPGLRIQIQDIGNLWHLWRQRDEGSHCTCVCKKIYLLILFFKLKVCMRIYTYIQRM